MDAAVGDVAEAAPDERAAASGAPAPGPAAGRAGDAPSRALLVAVLAAVNLPIVVATVRALARGWQPVGDNGILLVRARDVATGNHPLLGSWTSASLVLDDHVNNPGPLYFDVVAPAVKVLGPWVGLAVGVMLVNMAAASLAVVAARRLAGTETMVAVALAAAGLQWALGSELLFDMWQPNALVLPFFAFLVVAAVLATGDVWMAPWVVGLGSLVVQTHMSHAVLVGVLTLACGGLCLLACRRSAEPIAWRRPLAWTLAVGVLAWIQPLIEQVAGPGRGNMSRIAAAATGGEASPIGWGRATRLVAEITTMGPWFTRSSYDGAVPPTPPDEPIHGIVGAGPALAVLGALGALVVVAAAWSVRAGRPRLATMVAVAGLALATAYAALATSPVNYIAVAVHQMRWLWPIAAFLTAAALAVVLSAVRLWAPAPAGRGLLAALAVAAVVVTVANLPTHTSRAPGPTDTADHLASGVELMAQLDDLEGRGTVLYDTSTLLFAEPYSGMTFAEMQDRDIPFVFDDEVSVRQFGEGRRHDGSADVRMWQLEGDAALDVPPGAERVAFVEGPSGPVALFVEPLG
ncbi:MAG TPA: hypothetical protein VFZ79_02165 [Acidimicrobiales bacterium]